MADTLPIPITTIAEVATYSKEVADAIAAEDRQAELRGLRAVHRWAMHIYRVAERRGHATQLRVDAALNREFGTTPLQPLARSINRLAEILPKGTEVESIFAEFDAVADYVEKLENAINEEGLVLDV